MLAVCAPVFQVYVTAPEAVNVEACPEQIVEGLAEITGGVFTTTVTTVELLQPVDALVLVTE